MQWGRKLFQENQQKLRPRFLFSICLAEILEVLVQLQKFAIFYDFYDFMIFMIFMLKNHSHVSVVHPKTSQGTRYVIIQLNYTVLHPLWPDTIPCNVD